MNWISASERDRARQTIESAIRRGASGAIVTHISSDRSDVEFASGKLKTVATEIHHNLSCRVIVNGRTGTAAGTDPAQLPALLDRAMMLAGIGAVSHFDRFPDPAPGAPVKLWSDSVSRLDREKMIADTGIIVDGLARLDPAMDCGGSAAAVRSRCYRVSSSGWEDECGSTLWSIGGQYTLAGDNDIAMDGTGRAWGEINDEYDPHAILAELTARYARGKRIAAPLEGTFPVLLAPGLFRRMLKPFFAGIDGRAVAKGTSPLKDRLGTGLFAPSINITDDHHIDFCPDSGIFDADGVPTRPTPLIQNGTLCRFLYDCDTAAMCGTEPTGHDDCSPCHPVVTAGTTPMQELLGSIRHGLYLRDLMGLWRGNWTNGDFAAAVGIGYVVENGEITGRAKDMLVSGNLFDLMRGNVVCSSDRETRHGFPWLLMDGVSVARQQR